MSLGEFYNEELVKVGDESLRLTVNFKAIDCIEGLVKEPMPEILPKVLGANAPLSLTGKVLWGLLREHHPDVSLDQAAGLMFGPEANKVGLAMGELLIRSFNLSEAKAKAENPPKRRGRSRSSARSG